MNAEQVTNAAEGTVVGRAVASLEEMASSSTSKMEGNQQKESCTWEYTRSHLYFGGIGLRCETTGVDVNRNKTTGVNTCGFAADVSISFSKFSNTVHANQ